MPGIRTSVLRIESLALLTWPTRLVSVDQVIVILNIMKTTQRLILTLIQYVSLFRYVLCRGYDKPRESRYHKLPKIVAYRSKTFVSQKESNSRFPHSTGKWVKCFFSYKNCTSSIFHFFRTNVISEIYDYFIIISHRALSHNEETPAQNSKDRIHRYNPHCFQVQHKFWLQVTVWLYYQHESLQSISF